MKTIQTCSIMIQNLCVPCFNRCWYCLLSWDGKAVGTEWERSIILAERFIKEIKEARPDVTVSFFYGYSMEHPNLITDIQTLRRLGSPMADLLQCDGMAMRNEEQCRELMITLFIPHGEGRGKSLNSIRLQQQDLSVLSPDSLKLLNRDLYHHYRTLYASDHKLDIYDVTDERQSGSRRY